MPAMTRVLKFGGAALRNAEGVSRVARIVRSHGGERPLLVVSAHYGVTDALDRLARDPGDWRRGWDELRVRHRSLLRELRLPSDLLDRHLDELRGLLAAGTLEADHDGRGEDDRPRVDYVLSFGERMSARIVAAFLQRLGLPAFPVDAFDLGLECARVSGRLEPPPQALAALRDGLAGLTGLPVVTGFVARDEHGDLITLGRDGTELTAAWLALATGAEEIQLWKEESGILTADPRVLPDARRVPRLTWDEAERLARYGSGVLHPESVGPARRSGARLAVLDARAPQEPGTRIEGEGTSVGVRAWVHDSGLFRVRGGEGDATSAARLLRVLPDGGWEALAKKPAGGWSFVLPVGGPAERSLDGVSPSVETWTLEDGTTGFVAPDADLAALLRACHGELPDEARARVDVVA